jgi:flagellar hook assembly protein FlgD
MATYDKAKGKRQKLKGKSGRYSFIMRTAYFCLLPFAICLLNCRSAHAISIITGPSLPGMTNNTISYETNGIPNGASVQFTLDSPGQVEVDFYMISPLDSSQTQVGKVIQTNISANVPTTVFWNARWLIGTDFARHDGTFLYQVTPSTNSTVGTALPASGDPAARFTISSLDIHNLSVRSSLDANSQPTFPYVITYNLAKGANVTATVTDSTGTIVRTIISAAPQAGESSSTQTITWDGLNSVGKSVSIGNYTLTLTASDLNSGDQAIPRTAPISVLSLAGAAADPQKTFENNVFVYPNPVQNGQGTFQMEAVRTGANLSLKIYTITGTLVFEQSFPGVAAGNIQQFVWPVTNQSGNKLGRGLYYYVVREDDAIGTLQTVKKMVVIP